MLCRAFLNKNLKTKEEDIEKHKHESGKLINKNLNLNNFELKKKHLNNKVTKNSHANI